MTFEELQINLNLVFDKEDKMKILKNAASRCKEGYFFVDDDGECYLFDKNGNLDNIKKIKILSEEHIRKDIKKIKIPTKITSIWNYAFFDCRNLTNVMISNNVTSIGWHAFSDCNRMTSVMIPNSVTSIEYGAFDNCSSLTSVTISGSVPNIEDHIFHGCSSLKKLIFKGKTLDKVKSMDNYPFGLEDESIIRVE